MPCSGDADGRLRSAAGGGESRCGAAEVWIPCCSPFRLRVSQHFSGAPFPHPAHQTGRAIFPHPAFGQELTRSPTRSCVFAL
jgi:hypothetical protein